MGLLTNLHGLFSRKAPASVTNGTISADGDDIVISLTRTFWLGILTGFVCVIGYSWYLDNHIWRLIYLFSLLSCASFMSGFFLGFLLGIPKRNQETDSAYNLSNNLIDISDWLTKIIIGLGLVEIRQMPEMFRNVGDYIQTNTNADTSVRVFSTCCIIYFFLFGLYYGYNYMRLRLSGHFRQADDKLLKKAKQLSETQDELNSTELTPREIDEETKQKLDTHEVLLKKVKKEEQYSALDWYYRGVAESEREEYSQALISLRAAVAKDPSFMKVAQAYAFIGFCYYHLGSYDQSIEYTKKVLDVTKEPALLSTAHFNLGLSYEEAGDFASSLYHFEEVLKILPTDQEALIYRADALTNVRRYDEAITELERLKQVYPGAGDVWYYLAKAYAGKENKAKVIENLEKAIDIDMQNKVAAANEKSFEVFIDDPDFKAIIS